MNHNIIEAVKEGARLALFAGVSYLVTYLLQYFGAMNQSETNIVVITFVLRMVDKWLAVQNKSIVPGKDRTGLSGF